MGKALAFGGGTQFLIKLIFCLFYAVFGLILQLIYSLLQFSNYNFPENFCDFWLKIAASKFQQYMCKFLILKRMLCILLNLCSFCLLNKFAVPWNTDSILLNTVFTWGIISVLLLSFLGRMSLNIFAVVSAGGWRGERRSSCISWGKEGEGPQPSSQSAGDLDG